MKGDDQVRFCEECRKNVYNLSALPREDAERLIRSRDGALCARLYRRADGTVLTADCPVGQRNLRERIALRFAAVLAAGLALFGLDAWISTTKTESRPQPPKLSKLSTASERPAKARELTANEIALLESLGNLGYVSEDAVADLGKR